MSLNDSKIRKLKPSAKPFKVSDSPGLYLLVKSSGSRHWYLKYRINGKEARMVVFFPRHRLLAFVNHVVIHYQCDGFCPPVCSSKKL